MRCKYAARLIEWLPRCDRDVYGGNRQHTRLTMRYRQGPVKLSKRPILRCGARLRIEAGLASGGSEFGGLFEEDDAEEGSVVLTDVDAAARGGIGAEADDLTVGGAATGFLHLAYPGLDGTRAWGPAFGEFGDGVVAGFVGTVGAEDLDADLSGGGAVGGNGRIRHLGDVWSSSPVLLPRPRGESGEGWGY